MKTGNLQISKRKLEQNAKTTKFTKLVRNLRGFFKKRKKIIQKIFN